MRGDSKDPSDIKAVSYLRLVDDIPFEAGSGDGPPHKHRAPLAQQRWGSGRKLQGETPCSRAIATRHSQDLPPEQRVDRAKRNSDYEEDLWREGILAAALFGIVAILYFAVFAVITRSVPTYIEWLLSLAWPMP